ncbi:MAG: OmpP1/FadL family transporter [Bdellovibrionales bacterium]
MSTFLNLLFVLLLPVESWADMNSTYGFGSTSAALAGSNRAKSYDAFTVERNPALMSFSGARTSYGLLGGFDQFQDLENVNTDSVFLGGSNTTSSVDTDVPDTLNVLVGSIWTFGSSDRDYRVGLTVSAPVDKVTEPTTKDLYQPQYAMYLSDSQRLSLSAAISRRLGERWSLGVGLAYYLVQGATYQSRMPSDGATARTTTANLKTTVKPAYAPLAGLAWKATDRQTWSLNYVGIRDSKLKARSEVVLGIVGATPVAFEGEASLFYDPETWSLGYTYEGENTDILLALDYERWGRFNGSAMQLSFITFQSTFRQYPVDAQYKDILVPRLGLSTRVGEGSVKTGLAYRPSPTPALEKETNFLDSDRVIYGLGYGFPSTLFGLLDSPLTIDLHSQVQYLMPKTVIKENPSSIGGPRYEVRGYVFSYGINFNVGI